MSHVSKFVFSPLHKILEKSEEQIRKMIPENGQTSQFPLQSAVPAPWLVP